MQEKSLLSRIYWPNTLFLIISPIVAAVFLPMEIAKNGLDAKLVALFVVLCLLTSLSITGGYHRLFAHRSYDGSKWFKFLYLVFGSAALQSSALKWCTDHRRHHRFVDKEEDPYSIRKGFWYAHIGWVFFKEKEEYKDKFAPDLEKDPLVAWQHKYYTWISLTVSFVLPMAIASLWGRAWAGLIFAGVARVVFTHHCTFLINSAAHYFGKQTYGDVTSARDNWLLAYFTYGEGYHSFHHRFQADYRNGIRWYQFDPTKWLIWFGSQTGFTWALKRAPDAEILKARLHAEAEELKAQGHCASRVTEFMERVQEAQDQWKRLKVRYHEHKNERITAMREARDLKIRELKLEIKLARIEFRNAWAQWRLLVSN